jgi:hypothetical protein
MMKISAIRGIIKRIFPVFVFSVFSGAAIAQQDLTIHLMPIIPQASYNNPAFRPTAKLYIGFPMLSSIYIGMGHNAFDFNDVVNKRSDDSLELTFDNVMDKMGKVNYFSTDVMFEMLGFGFKVKKNYFSFSMSTKVSEHLSYPRELLSLAWKGDGQYVGKTADFTGLGLNMSHYYEYALGFARDVKLFDMDFVVGGRLKYLAGLMNVSTKRNTIKLGVAENDFALTAQTDVLLNCSLPQPIYNQLDSNEFNNKCDYDPRYYFFNPLNKGLGIDLGASYKLNNQFSFGASIVDLGYIKWKYRPKNITSNVESFTFDGINVDNIVNGIDSTALQNQVDSIKDVFQVSKTENAYSTSLPTKIYLTGVFTLTPNDKVGLLIRNEFFNKRIHPALALSYNKRVLNMLSASISYSMISRSYANIGLGVAVNFGPFEMYLVTDNINKFLPLKMASIKTHEADGPGDKDKFMNFPSSIKYMNVHFGMNFIFGYKEKKIGKSLYNDTPKVSAKTKKHKNTTKPADSKETKDVNGVKDQTDPKLPKNTDEKDNDKENKDNKDKDKK